MPFKLLIFSLDLVNLVWGKSKKEFKKSNEWVFKMIFWLVKEIVRKLKEKNKERKIFGKDKKL